MAKIVCIDPGHGGNAQGACHNGLREKDIVLSPDLSNLGIAERVGHHLRAHGIKTVMTRFNDTNVNLSERTRIARTAGADVFVSIHCNSAANKTAEGYEVLCHPKDTKGSKRLAEMILGEFEKTPLMDGMKNRGVKHGAKLAVLNGSLAWMPAVLIEVGFISNKDDAKRMRDRHWREAVAGAIAKAVQTFLTGG